MGRAISLPDHAVSNAVPSCAYEDMDACTTFGRVLGSRVKMGRLGKDA